MITTDRRRRNARLRVPEPATHLFEVGQSVRLAGGLGALSNSDDIYCVTATLPPLGDSPQYRIRNDEERHERVVTQDGIKPVDTSQSDAGDRLIERTFGHGQGSKTQ